MFFNKNSEIIDRLSDSHKLLGGVYLMDSIPRGPTGKILRRKVKEIVKELKAMETIRFHWEI